MKHVVRYSLKQLIKKFNIFAQILCIVVVIHTTGTPLVMKDFANNMLM
jgi:hypothetical protein